MPNIVPPGGIRLTSDVVKIHDILPSKVRKEQKLYTEDRDGEHDRIMIMDAFGLGGRPGRVSHEEPPAEHPEEEPELAAEAEEEPEAEPEESPLAAEILQNALDEAESILAAARQEAEAERLHILDEARAEAESMRQQAAAQGHREAVEAVEAQLRQALDDLEAQVAKMEGEVAGFEADYEEQLRWMSLEIATRLLNRKVAENDAVLTAMVERAVHGMKNEPWLRVEVAQEMTRLIGKLQDLYDEQEQIDVSPIPAEEGTILLETASGVTDISLKTQLENLRRYFQKSHA